MSDSENDLFGDEQTSPAAAPSPGSGMASSPAPAPPPRRVDPDEESDGEQAGADAGGASDGEAKDRGEDKPASEDGNNLFGDTDDEGPPPRSPSTRDSTPDSTRRLEYPEEEVETSEVVANVPVPTWSRLAATDGKVWHVKLPAYVNVEPRPFTPEYYRATNEDTEEVTGPAAKGRMIGVRNTIRWRWDGGERQTNARMLRWSDGSVSLQLGSDLYDLAPSYGATLARPEDEKAKQEEGKSTALPTPAARETSFLCVTAPEEQVLVTEAAIAGQLSLVPTSMDSKTHRELVMHVGAQHEKHSRMMILDDAVDSKKVAELLARAAPQRQAAKPSSSRVAHARRSVADSLGGRRGERFKREASDDSEFEERERRRARDRDYDEDDGFVVADSDSEDDEYSRKRKSKAKNKAKAKRRHYDTDEDDEDDDDLDAAEIADRRIEEAERKSKKKGKKATKDVSSEVEEDDAEGEDDGDMDVESEED